MKNAEGSSLERVEKKSKDLERFLSHREGVTVMDIAKRDRIDPASAESSIRRGSRIFEGEQQMQLRSAKYDNAIAAEKLRTDTHKSIATIFVDAIKTLLQGKRTIVEKNKLTGQITMHEITDPEIIAIGLAAARKTLSLEEKVGPSMVFNFQQNNMGEPGSEAGGGAMTYEERLERIQAAQSGHPVPKSREIIETHAKDVTPQPTNVEIVDDDLDEEVPLF